MTDTEVVLGDVHSPDYSGEYAAQNSVDYKRDERVSIQCELKPITMRGAEEAGYSCTARLMLDTGEDLREFRQRFVSLRRLREELAAFASLEAEKGKLQLEIARLLVVDASLEMKREMVARATELEAVEAAFAKRSRNKDILEDPGLFKSLETLSQKWQAVGLPKVSFTLYRLLKDPATGRTVGVPLQVYGEHRSSVQFMEPL